MISSFPSHCLSLVLLLLFVLAFTCVVATTTTVPPNPKDKGLQQPARVDIYIMSKCSDAQSFFQYLGNELIQLQPILDMKIEFIAKINESEPSGFSSPHGPTEVEGDLYEACAQYLYPYSGIKVDYFDLIMCVNPQMYTIPKNIPECTKRLNMDLNLLNKCASDSVGKLLLTQSIVRTQKVDVRWSPAIYINEQEYCLWGESAKCKAKNKTDFIRDICQASTITPKPNICTNILYN